MWIVSELGAINTDHLTQVRVEPSNPRTNTWKVIGDSAYDVSCTWIIADGFQTRGQAENHVHGLRDMWNDADGIRA